MGMYVNVRDFGAIGDGLTDNYEAIQAAIRCINERGGGTLVFPRGIYRVIQHRIEGSEGNGIRNFEIEKCDSITIEGDGSTLDMDGDWVRKADFEVGNSGRTDSNHNSVCLWFYHCKNIAVSNLTLNGNVNLMTSEADNEGPSHGIGFFSCKHIRLTNVHVHHFASDGLMVSRFDASSKACRHIVAIDCRFRHNARQGCTLAYARYATFINCSFSRTGVTQGNYKSHSPTAGIDVEHGAKKGDYLFINCRFRYNLGSAFVATTFDSVPFPIKFVNCEFIADRANSITAIKLHNRTTQFDGCRFVDVGIRPIADKDLDQNVALLVRVRDCEFISHYADDKLIVHGYPNARLEVSQCRFEFLGGLVRSTRIRLDMKGPRVRFWDNDIWINGLEHTQRADRVYDTKFIFSKGDIRDNRWHTDLEPNNGHFVISYEGSDVRNDKFFPAKAFSPGTSVIGSDTHSSGKYAIAQLELGNTDNPFARIGVQVATAPPEIHNHKLGDIVFNTKPEAGGQVGWVCVESGSSLVWKPFGTISG